ncbi:hypothetical protein PENANT_c008G02301 [Penicillium antarcticum]|uniref:U4/U6.U5 small nuclear ribonucleoprotein 27kDa protein domain-containing protein n=1 Tax=Penicillium antarcticum TaxID=416450 RepID=A0A1V6QBD4_9EURO|nr:uncharacterized protein N7508_007126 [Penicillium antarcticum]KAJ5302263.1 hypothetical protein N7508_007126 [Penicillium antarcticum]OQD86302.1 hypothetical protein PENANT_c008G02301 [Penicillium antarcticum]
MAEPPAKRARRVDSTAMWDSNDNQPRASESESARDRRASPPRDDRRDGRYRSRSREHNDRRRERSWSRDRRDRDRRDGGRDGRGAQDRKKSISREHDYDRRGNAPKSVKFRERSRSRSPARNGTRARSPPRGPKGDRRDPRSREDPRIANGASEGPRHDDEMDMDINEDADEDEIEAQMRKAMGFTRFRTTKNTKIPGNDIYGVRKEKKIEYRQYMNRQGGFNRPLSPSR